LLERRISGKEHLNKGLERRKSEKSARLYCPTRGNVDFLTAREESIGG